jgi:hypothetical protein
VTIEVEAVQPAKSADVHIIAKSFISGNRLFLRAKIVKIFLETSIYHKKLCELQKRVCKKQK